MSEGSQRHWYDRGWVDSAGPDSVREVLAYEALAPVRVDRELVAISTGAELEMILERRVIELESQPWMTEERARLLDRIGGRDQQPDRAGADGAYLRRVPRCC